MPDTMETTPDVLQRQLEKFESKNPIARALVSRFNRTFVDLVRSTGAQEALEVGCGEGELLKLLTAEGVSSFGIDINQQELDYATQRLAGVARFRGVANQDVYKLDEKHKCELVVCCEVLEHLSEPEAALDILVRLANPWLILSVPREPIWRAMNMMRGKYWGALGNTPSHINHWSCRGFRRLVGKRIDIISIRTPLPWTMLLAKRAD